MRALELRFLRRVDLTNIQIFASGWDAKRLLEENRAYKNDVRLRGLGVDFNPRRRVLFL
jgi:hypothetical protein